MQAGRAPAGAWRPVLRVVRDSGAVVTRRGDDDPRVCRPTWESTPIVHLPAAAEATQIERLRILTDVRRRIDGFAAGTPSIIRSGALVALLDLAGWLESEGV